MPPGLGTPCQQIFPVTEIGFVQTPGIFLDCPLSFEPSQTPMVPDRRIGGAGTSTIWGYGLCSLGEPSQSNDLRCHCYALKSIIPCIGCPHCADRGLVPNSRIGGAGSSTRSIICTANDVNPFRGGMLLSSCVLWAGGYS